jgi:hypothetical protein
MSNPEYNAQALHAAFGIVWQAINVLEKAIANGQEFECDIVAGERDKIPPPADPKSILDLTELDGSYHITIDVKAKP